MTHILTPIGRRPLVKINETAEQVADTHINIELDLGHFYNYVMENFPELTEEYIDENYEQVDELSNKTLGSYVVKARKSRDVARGKARRLTSNGPPPDWSLDRGAGRRLRVIPHPGLAKARAVVAKRKVGIDKALHGVKNAAAKITKD